MNTLIIIVILCFSCIQAIEVLSYLSRLSGVLIDKKSMAYTLQNAVFMITRFFTLALMPILGLLVDMGIDKKYFLILCIGSFLVSSIICSFIIYFKNRSISAFITIIELVVGGRQLLPSLLRFPKLFTKKNSHSVNTPSATYLFHSNIFWLSSIVFFSYATSLFFVFFLGLFFPDYRVMLSQTSGVINAFSTIILTFWIEPKLSLAIEKDSLDDKKSSPDLIMSLLIGRVFGVGIYSSIFFILFL